MTGFEVVVLGGSGTFPAPDSPCSGFLLRAGGSDVWIDAGTGTFSNLQRHADFFEVKALLLSHLHIDHVADLYPFYYAFRYSPRNRGAMGFPVFAPSGSQKHLEHLVCLTSDDGFGGILDFRTIATGDEIKIDPFEFSFQRTEHPVETLGMRIEAQGRRLVYTADTGPSNDVVELARGADVLIAEASMQAPVESLAKVHMTAAEAGILADQAGAGRLVLTHIVPGQDPEVSRQQAAEQFSGEILIASQHLRFSV